MTSNSTRRAIAYARENYDTFLTGFDTLLRFPSISTDPTHQTDLEGCADWIVAEMARIGLKNSRKIATDGHPVVYGEWLEAGDDRPTVLIYAHYDVQPVDPLELWISPPFEPTLRDGKWYARGIVDDKSGVYFNLKALESILAVDGRLPVNVKLFFEGEEEMGSPNMLPFVAANKELLRADLLLLCDGPLRPEQPSLAYALRGIVAAEVLVAGPAQDLHSGAYGGTVHNPLHQVGKIVGSFHDDDGRVQIPRFYDRVRPLGQSEKKAMERAWQILAEQIKDNAGVDQFWAESLAPYMERATALPTLDVNGIWGGYQGDGVKTVIPARAGFKVTMRLVADQDPAEIGELFKAYVESYRSPTLNVKARILAEAWPLIMDLEGPFIETVQRTFEVAVGQRPLLVRGGGSIPIGGMFQHELGMPIVKLGLGSGGQAHSPNEYLNEEHLSLGIEMAIRFYYLLAAADIEMT